MGKTIKLLSGLNKLLEHSLHMAWNANIIVCMFPNCSNYQSFLVLNSGLSPRT